MIISVNWLKKYTDIDVTIDELTALIGTRLVEIEGVNDLGKKYDGVIIARIVSCRKLEGSDHLNVTKIDDGSVAKDVERDENGYVQVVCGAPNVREGLLVAWLPPKSTVPETFDDSEPFVLSARKLRGAMSNGMLASAKELDLFDDHAGILEINQHIEPGSRFADAFELDDYLLDIENKSLTHRPDTFGIIGFAREVAAIQGKPFKSPDWLLQTSPQYVEVSDELETPHVTIDDPSLSDRYQAVVLKNADSSALSPVDTQTYLSRVGVRPISAVVDVTNYLMMLTGQPLHAFDYDKLSTLNNGKVDIHVRAGRKNETLKLIDGRVIELSENDIVIANGDIPVALAGAMGGADTEIDETTKNIFLESATFNLYNLRNTQMRHGIFSEAITRFTKGQPAGLTGPVLHAAIRLLRESAGAICASNVIDSGDSRKENDPITVAISKINDTLGSKFMASDIVDTLQNAEFTVGINEDNSEVTVTAPYWRSDIHIPEDIIEEIGRLNGFDLIEVALPKRDFAPVSPDNFDTFRSTVRAILARGGANEVLNYSFVHGDIIEKANQNKLNSYRIINSISPDLQYYRLTLTPSLLNLVHTNKKAGYESFALFEMNKVHSKIVGLEENVPKEINLLALTIVKKQTTAAFYDAKRLLDFLGQSLNLEFIYKSIDSDPGYDESAPFEYRRSAMVYDARTDKYVGIIGEYKKSVQKAFKLGDTAAGFELDAHALFDAATGAIQTYKASSKFPSSQRDVCFRVAANVEYWQVYVAANSRTVADIDIAISPLDIYQAGEEDTKNITLRFTITPYNKTLTSDEIQSIVQEISQSVITATNAKVI